MQALLRRAQARLGPCVPRLLALLCAAALLLWPVSWALWPAHSVHRGLVYNVGLAALPLLCALGLVLLGHPSRAKPLSALLWLLWLALLPNAPYMLTDFIHIQEYSYSASLDASPSAYAWLGYVQILACIAVGVMLGFCSLYLCQSLVARRHGPLWGWALGGAACLASGIGMFIGRFLRFNSWDLWRSPRTLLLRLGERPLPQALGFCLLFTGLTLGAYLLFYACVGPAGAGGNHGGSQHGGSQNK